MYLIYQPEGQDEPTRWKYNPRRLMAVEREDLERRTSRNFSTFTTDVVQGNALCRRALLFTYLRRDHPKVKFEDVDFTWDEVKLAYSQQELHLMREDALETLHGDQLAAALASFDKAMETAYDEDEVGEGGEGKAQLPIAD
ncbi:hypothetical protein ABT160_02710 [Streptomyces sp. NPDC001941]|uniref:hypothetical protein n=1 Tax=Streptomyces sp. NPDC001941 TaxID=3154659 RepID=UPI003328C86E